MVKVTCELSDYTNPAMPSIRIHNHWSDRHMVEIEADGKRYVVKAKDLIAAVENALNTNEWG